MKISLNWLSDYINVDKFYSHPEELDKILTSAGLEVEAIENQREQYKNVVVGHIIEKGKHPDADKLSICQVDVGAGKPQQIICGASNHKQGDKVVVALPGAILPGDFVIKKSKIRGVESLGMLCSEKELALSDDSQGIIILDQSAPVGVDFSEFANLNDVVFELSVTPNRADCLSHLGLARELACILGIEYKKPEINISKTSGSVKDMVVLELNDSELCPRYCGRAIRGVRVGESPEWLKQKLEAVGLNSINNVVDVTNFVMMELGQPLHAFDAKEIKGQKIIIDKSKKNEKFTTLDGTELTLTGEELMIRDDERSVALAGVVGGLNSGVSEETENIFLESAHFVPQTVRRTSRKYGVNTDSAYRFSRGTDPEGVEFAMNRACYLIQQVAGGEVSVDQYDEYPKPHIKKEIAITQELLETRLGYAVDMEEFEKWMNRLGCEVKVEKNVYKVTPPPFRWDIDQDMDLVEEYGRLYGYDKIPESLPLLNIKPTEHHSSYVKECMVTDVLRREGYLQAVNYGFVSSKKQNELFSEVDLSSLNIDSPAEGLRILNPLNDETDVMRSSLLVGLFKNLLHNYRHGMESGRLFEIGQAFSKKETEYVQSTRLSLIGWGHSYSIWQKEERPVVFDIKAAIENTLNMLKARSWQWKELSPEQTPKFIHPKQCAALFFEGKLIGFIGTLHPTFKAKWKLRHEVAVAEINADLLMDSQPRKPKLKKLSKFPAVERDLSFIVPDDMASELLVKEVKKVNTNLIQSVEVFDIYRGQGVEQGFSSMTIRLVIQDINDTLKDEQLSQLQDKIIQTVQKKLNLKTR